MTMNKFSLILLFSLLSTSFLANSETGVKSLSPELQKLLRSEMRAIDQGMKDILSAQISGDLEEVSHIAHDIKNSFVIKQKLTTQQKHELHKKLPKSFLMLDKKFHNYAGMLSHVAVEQHAELVGFYFTKMTDLCVDCHSQFAKHRFPKFTVQKEPSHHH